MYDSSSNVLHGVFKGNGKMLNHFDECLSVEPPEESLTTQFCMLDMDVFVGRGGLQYTGNVGWLKT